MDLYSGVDIDMVKEVELEKIRGKKKQLLLEVQNCNWRVGVWGVSTPCQGDTLIRWVEVLSDTFGVGSEVLMYLIGCSASKQSPQSPFVLLKMKYMKFYHTIAPLRV